MAKALNQINLSVNIDTQQARLQMQQLQQSLQTLKTTPVTISANIDTSKAIGQIGQLQQHLREATNTETGVLNFTKLNSSIKSSGMTLQDYGKTLLSLGPAGKDSFNQLATAVSKAQVPIFSLGSSFSQLWTTMKNTMRWQLSSSAFHAVLGTMQKAWGYAQALNESLTNIQIVTKQSDEQMIRFAESANKAAQELSTTTTAYTNAALIYYQQGLNDKQVKERTDVTIKMANVTGQSAQQVSDQMTAIWNNFDDGTHSLEYYADVITALGAATASSSEEISKGLSKFAAVADTVGLSYENATAALATITATTRQSADTVGTGLRTLFSRLQSLSLGETLEDGVNLTKYSKALKTVGVEALDAEGNLRKMDDVLADLGEKWQGLSDAQKTALAQTVGGVRQYATIMALMDNNDFFKKNQQVAKASTGELQAQEQVYEKSWEAARKRLRAAAESIYSDVIDDQFFIGLTNGFSGLLKIMDNFIDGLGGIKGLLFGVVSAVTTLNKNGSTKFFNQVIDGFKSLTPGGRASLLNEQQKSIKSLQSLVDNKDYSTVLSRTQNNVLGYNLQAQSAYLENRSNYTAQQDIQAQALLTNLESINNALVQAAQNFQGLKDSTQGVRQQFTDLVAGYGGNFLGARDRLFNANFQEYTNVTGTLRGYGVDISKEQAQAFSTEEFNKYMSSLKLAYGQMGTITNPGLNQAFTNVLSSTGVGESFANAVGALETSLLNLRSVVLDNAKVEGMDASQQARLNQAATNAIEQNIEARRRETKVIQLDAEAKKNVSALQSGSFLTTPKAVSPGQYVTEGMSLMSSTAMGLSMLKGGFNQIAAASKGQTSWGDALLSVGTSLPFGMMMLNNAGKSLNTSALLNNAFQKTDKWKELYNKGYNEYLDNYKSEASSKELDSLMSGLKDRGFEKDEKGWFQRQGKDQHKKYDTDILKRNTEQAEKKAAEMAEAAEVTDAAAEAGAEKVKDAGLFTKLGPVLGAGALYIAAIAAIGASIWVASELVVTSKERFDQLNKTLEQNKQRVTQVNQKYDTLNSSFKKQNELDEQIKNAKVGSIERNTAIVQANQNAAQIISDNNLTSEDYSIKNGRIILNEGVEERLQHENLDAIKKANQDVLTSQAAVAAQKVQIDFEDARKKIYSSSEDFGEQYSLSAANDWVKKNTQYGYTSGQDLINAMKSGQLQSQMELTGGVAQKRKLALEQKLLDQNGKITDDESLLVDILAQNSDVYKNIDDQVRINTNGGAAFISALEFWNTKKSSGNMTLGELQRYAQENYGKEYEDLIKSDEYKQADRKGQRQQLANLIETNRRQKLIDEQFEDNQKKLKEFQDKYGKNILGQTSEELYGENGLFKDLFSGKIEDETHRQIALAYLDQQHEAQMDYIKLGNSLGLNMIDAYNKHTSEEAQKIIETTTNFQSSFGDEFAKMIYEKLDQKEDISSLTNLELTGNTISDLKILKDSNLKNAVTGKTYFEEARASLGGGTGLLESLYDSEGFADSLTSLQDEFKKTGEISADSILKAAETCKELSDYLDISEVNAQGLADALDMVELGDIKSIKQLSDGLLKALSTAGQLKSSLAETYNHMDNFDAGRSTEDIVDFSQKLTKNITNSFNKGNFVDEPLLKSWEEMFGEESRQKYIESVTKYASQGMSKEEIQKQIKEDYKEEFDLFESLGDATDMMSVFEYGLKKTNKYDDYFRIVDGNFQVQTKNLIDLINQQEDGLDGLYADMAQEMNISENMAQEMINHMASSYPSVKKAIEKNSLSKAIEEGLFESGETVDAQGIRAFINQYQDVIGLMTQEDFAHLLGIENITDQLDDFTATAKMTSETALEMLRLKAEKAGAKVFDLGKNFDYANASFEDLQKAWDKNKNKISLDDYFKDSKVLFNDDKKGFDVDKLLKQYEKLGITGSTANKMIEQQLKDYTGPIRKVFKDLEGNPLEIDWKKENESLEEFQERAQKALDLKNAEISARKIAEALNEIGVNLDIKIDKEGLQGTIQNIMSNGTKGWTFQIDTDSIALQVADAYAKGIQQGKENAGTANNSTDSNGTKIPDSSSNRDSASGYNNAKGTKGFAGGKHSNGQYEGPAIVGELGPEAWVHNGKVDLVGQQGREMIYVHANDQIFTAAQTRNMPGFKDGVNNDDNDWEGGGYSKKSNADSKIAREADFDPERYHLVMRQLKDLQREYDRLNKLKENAYGTNKLEAIQREVQATQLLINKQKELIQEAEDYLKIDAGRLKGLLTKDEFQIDENGNLLNYNELQDKYRRQAETKKNAEGKDLSEDELKKVTDTWKALEQYEETLDKLNEANDEMRDLLYQEMELRLEKITTKVEMRIDFDDREIKLLDHYIERIDDNIYHTAEVLALTEQKLGHINQKIEDTKVGIAGLFEELSDSEGKLIRKDDGSAYTLEEWLAMSKEQRDLLDINDNFGKQLEEYMDNILDYIEELEEFKTKGVEEFGEAFDELNDNVRSSIDLFDHYNQLLSSLKNITDLQGVKLSAEMKATMKAIDQAMFNNTQNNIDAERENYRRLASQVADLRQKVAETQDETLKKAWEEQLKTAEEELRTSEQNMLSLWETGLQQAKDMFESALEEAATNYEETIAGMYGTTDELQKAWDQQKKNDEFYVKDYEKYYQISKLQRSITKDLDAAARSGNRQNQGLKKLYDELNAKRENGVELSAYDLDIFEKRYEYEKALMELEDARNNKSEVRLQRDASGNWGYVYTSAADEDDLIAKQQAVDDKFYELQKATQERVASLSDDMMAEITGVGRRLQELRSSGASQETIDKYLEQERKYLENYEQGLAKALADAGMTEEEARLRYGNEGFDILDQFSETLLSSIMGGNETLDEFFARVGMAMDGTNDEMAKAADDYQGQMDEINKWFNESGEDLAKVIKGFAAVIDSESEGNLIDSKEQIQNAKDTFDEILKVATDFEKEFIKIYQPIIDENEKLVADLLYALHALNREEYEGPGHEGYHYDFGSFDELPGPEEDTGGETVRTGKDVIKYTPDGTGTHSIEVNGKITETHVKCTADTRKYVVGGGMYEVTKCKYCGQRLSMIPKFDPIDDDTSQTPTLPLPFIGGGGCLAPGTKILMADYSYKNIEDIKENDLVLAYNENTKELKEKLVLKTYSHYHTPKMIKLLLNDNTNLILTPGHPVLTLEGWKSLDILNSLFEHQTVTTLLQINDYLISLNNQIKQIIKIEELNIDDNYTSYNIEIDDFHTYFANDCLVHNTIKSDDVWDYRHFSLASGGYTGAWGPSGRMAVLHEKELVLNKDDTEKFLAATNILRTIDLQTNLFSKGLGGIITPWIDDMKSQELEQDVHIEANFPNVQDRHEIEAAFDNLINKASQYANRKNMSAMTFQDMYTSKF